MASFASETARLKSSSKRGIISANLSAALKKREPQLKKLQMLLDERWQLFKRKNTAHLMMTGWYLVETRFTRVVGNHKIKSEVHKVARLVRFTRDGMEYYDEKCQKWYQTEAFLREILTGKAVVMR